MWLRSDIIRLGEIISDIMQNSGMSRYAQLLSKCTIMYLRYVTLLWQKQSLLVLQFILKVF